MLIDSGVSSRQSFGVRFNYSSSDVEDAQRIVDGVLLLPPHPDWELPSPDAISWKENPFSDNNWLTQFHMLRWLDPVRRVALKGDSSAGDLWVRYVRSWWEVNKPSDALNRFVWEDMVDGIRALVLVLGAPLILERWEANGEWFIEAVDAHIDWLSQEEHLGHGNHALHQHVGLFVAGALRKNGGAKDLAVSRLMDLFEHSYDVEGLNTEGAVGYHLLNLKWWNDAVRRLMVEGLAMPPVFDRLKLAPVALAHATRPTGSFVSIGDTDGGHPGGIDAPETKWMSSKGAVGAPPESNTAVFQSGYYFTRSGWGAEGRAFEAETFLSARFGPANRIHGHPDGTSLTYTANGVDWLVDPGKFVYGRHPMRTYCKSRSAHNSVSIAGLKYDLESNVVLSSRRSSVSTEDLIFDDPGFGAGLLRRRVIYSNSGEYFVAIDNIDSPTSVKAIQNWQFGEGIRADTNDVGARLTSKDGRVCRIRYIGTKTNVEAHIGAEDPLKGWVSVGWKKAAEAPSIEFSKAGKRFRFITVVAAGYRDEDPLIEPLRTGNPDLLAIKVSTGRVEEMLVITPGGSLIAEVGADPVAVGGVISEESSRGFDYTDESARNSVLDLVREAYDGAESVSSAEREQRSALLFRDAYGAAMADIDLGVRSAMEDLSPGSVQSLGVVHKTRSPLVNWSDLPEYVSAREQLPIHYASDFNQVSALEPDAIYTWLADSVVLPALVSPAQGDVLTVLFHGALDRGRVQLPVYERVRFQKSLEAGPFMAFGDPTLDLSRSLRLGWYLGTNALDLVPFMASIIESLRDALGVERILLVGSSGGGFAALQVGACIPGSQALVFNPQTDLRRYYPGPFSEAANAVFGTDSSSRLAPYGQRLSAIERIAEHASNFTVNLVGNAGDKVHQTSHFDPLREAAGELSTILLHETTVDWGSGHRSPTNNEYEEAVAAIYRDLRR